MVVKLGCKILTLLEVRVSMCMLWSVTSEDNNDHSFLVPFTDISMQDKMVIYDNEKQMIGWGPGNCDQLPKSRSFSFWWCFVRFSDLHIHNGVWSQRIILQKETFSAIYYIGLEGNSSISTVHFIYFTCIYVFMYVCRITCTWYFYFQPYMLVKTI